MSECQARVQLGDSLDAPFITTCGAPTDLGQRNLAGLIFVATAGNGEVSGG